MNRREFLRGLGAALACYGGAKLLPNTQRNALIEWGKENDILRPAWQGWTPSQWIWQGKQITWYTGDGLTSRTISASLSIKMWERWMAKGPLLGEGGYMIFNFSSVHRHTVPVRFQGVQELPDGSAVLYFERGR